MSQTLPQSQLGPIVTKRFADGFAKVRIADKRALIVKNLSPQPTVWKRTNSKPIYERLPAISEAYQKDFFGENNRGMVYINSQFGSLTGPGSLEVGALETDRRVLVVYNGIITWANGQIPTETLAFNLETVIEDGVQDGAYQVGYYLDIERPLEQKFAKYRVENTSLGNSATQYNVTLEAPNHPLRNAIADFRDGTWKPTEFSNTGPYETGVAITFDFTEPVVAEIFDIFSRKNFQSTAFCALYRSDDAISWYLEESVSPTSTGWQLRNSYENSSRYYRLFFWGGVIDISEVKYSGEALFPDVRPVGPVSVTELFLEPLFDQIDRPHILLATLEVRNFEIIEIQDRRSTTSVKYEPVAKWLTSFQDETLRSIFTSVENYSQQYLSPIEGADKFYDELFQSNFDLNDDTSALKIVFPRVIQTREDTRAQKISLLEDPIDSSDLATLAYAKQTLTPSLDNGQY